jgi:general secretion pathway protein G
MIAAMSLAVRCRQRGFTLIEIMVVVVIIGLLAAFVVPRVVGQVDQARIVKAQGDIQKIEAALSMYRLDTSRYPTTEQGLKALVVQPENVRNWRPGGYLSKASVDPWGGPYLYRSPGANGGDYDIYSLGPDGEEGTPEKDADNVSNSGLDAVQPQ